MKITTTRFGEIDVEADKVVHFAQGIPGFEQMHSYVFLQPQAGNPFSFMQSLEDGNLAFVVTNPFLFFPDYDFDLPGVVEQELGLEEQADVMLFSIVTVSQSKEMSLNLLAPIVLNQRSQVGKQVILQNTEYKTKHKVEPQVAAQSANQQSGKTGDR